MASSRHLLQLKTESEPIIFLNKDELIEAIHTMEYNQGKQQIYVKFLREYVPYLRDEDPEKESKTEQLQEQEARLAMVDHDVKVLKEELVAQNTS